MKTKNVILIIIAAIAMFAIVGMVFLAGFEISDIASSKTEKADDAQQYIAFDSQDSICIIKARGTDISANDLMWEFFIKHPKE